MVNPVRARSRPDLCEEFFADRVSEILFVEVFCGDGFSLRMIKF